MRIVPVLLFAATLTSCTAHPPVAAVDPYGAARLNSLIAGKVAGPPSRCLSFRISNVRLVNANTLAYDAGARTYINRVQGTCGAIGPNNYSIVTRPFGFGGPCRGDLVHLVEPGSGIPAGSCVLGDFVPYTAPGR